MLTLLVVIAVALVLFGAAAVATSDRDLLVEVAPDSAGTALPPGRIGAGEVDALRFGLALRGYRMDEVDRALARLAQELAESEARVAELEQAIADAVGPAVDDVEARLAVDRAAALAEPDAAWADAQVDAQVDAELAAAREEAPQELPEQASQQATGDVPEEVLEAAAAASSEPPSEPAPDRTAGGAAGLAAVAAWAPVTSTTYSAPWQGTPGAAAPVPPPGTAAEVPSSGAAAPVPHPAAPLVADEPRAPEWPAAEPTHPEPLVPDAVVEEAGAQPEPAPRVEAGPDEPDSAAGLFDFPEVVPPVQAGPDLPDAKDADADEDRGLT